MMVRQGHADGGIALTWAGISPVRSGPVASRSGALPKYDFQSPRLHVSGALGTGNELTLDKGQAHYLRNVLRLKPGTGVLVFNGKDGEWRATLTDGKRVALTIE